MKLTKREQFALAAMQAIIRKMPYTVVDGDDPLFTEIADGAVAYADAIIDALKPKRKAKK